MTSLPGGWIADRLIGQRRAVLWGGILIACGHFSMAFPSLSTFYLGLVLIVRRHRPAQRQHQRARRQVVRARTISGATPGFSIYYMGINLGAFVAPLVCGFLGQRVSWHVGFAAAGVGMALGVVQYVLGGRHLGTAGLEPAPAKSPRSGRGAAPPGRALGRRGAVASLVLLGVGLVTGVLAITPTQVADVAGYLLLVTTVVFFGWLFFAGDWTPRRAPAPVRRSASSSWRRRSSGRRSSRRGRRSTCSPTATRRTSLFGWEFPSSWFQSVNAIFIIAFAPVFAWLWLRLGPREPSSPIKFSLGLIARRRRLRRDDARRAAASPAAQRSARTGCSSRICSTRSASCASARSA